ncbi:SAM-dependent chlorinase/fluorinase [Acidianus sp. HS-5]|uniref:SAM hydrolase/SAM-dependent halogenase family protein n=1 Tax=Acidianus sp. HS-5 TaxID=2886040 RepID=UPI001F2C8BB2|nr:SAM-dependent chlorinase/fluorinase [Acidianus sp. HS-5]BDC19260.1 hypothetical protein HS5_21500 [Acidianus sp. HS-5]
MEAVIKKINNETDITYVTPNAKNFNIYAASYLLYTSYRYFKKGTIFLVVIDPGVGTNRKAIIVKTKNYFFVGPDNGVLYPAVSEDGINEVIEISNPKPFLSKYISKTFHGRDIFATAAGFLSAGVSINIFGPEVTVDQLVKLKYTYNIKEKNIVCGKVIYIDHFGNTATSIRGISFTSENVKIIFNNNIINARKVNTFGESEGNEFLVYKNGYGFVEIGINKENASIKLNATEGEDVCLEGSIQEDFSHST